MQHGWWRRCRPARFAARTRSCGRRAEEVGGDGRDDAGGVGVRGGVGQPADALRRVTGPNGSACSAAPRGAGWVRLVRGSQWHAAGAPCAPRSGELTWFVGRFPPRAGGFVVCLECAYLAGVGAEAAAYVPAWPAEVASEVAEVMPGRHSVDRVTAVFPRASGPEMRAGAEAPGSGYLPGTPTPAVEATARAAA